MTTDNILVSIIIVNYNGKHFLDDCLSSIKKLVSVPYEIIIVDNASSDGSCDYIKTSWPDIKLVESKENSGFTGGNNLGVSQARGALLFLVNNDTKLLSDIKVACNMFSVDPNLGVVGGRLYYGDGRQQFSIGLEHSPLRIILSWAGAKKVKMLPSLFRREILDEESYTLPHDSVSWVSGACLITRRALWQKLHGLDEQYFMYVEDVDYCKRVRLAGYRVAYTPGLQIVHYEGAGKAWVGDMALARSLRSYLIYTEKFYGPFAALFLRFGLSLIFFLRALAYRARLTISKSDIVLDKCKASWNVSMKLLFNRLNKL
ncbi:MAG: glycosyltransferase family 2 protein [Deltaproteobacteria bacterium]|nr:glycosyltransferase family 2 protein [Deltaproteobacteria bacterium]